MHFKYKYIMKCVFIYCFRYHIAFIPQTFQMSEICNTEWVAYSKSCPEDLRCHKIIFKYSIYFLSH